MNVKKTKGEFKELSDQELQAMSDEELFSSFADFLDNEVDVPLAEMLAEGKKEFEKNQKLMKNKIH